MAPTGGRGRSAVQAAHRKSGGPVAGGVDEEQVYMVGHERTVVAMSASTRRFMEGYLGSWPGS